jgi:hypothetical protein
VISHLTANPADRLDDEVAPGRHPRPLTKPEKEQPY